MNTLETVISSPSTLLVEFLAKFHELNQGQHPGLDLEVGLLIERLKSNQNTADNEADIAENYEKIISYQAEIQRQIFKQQSEINESALLLQRRDCIDEDLNKNISETIRIYQGSTKPATFAGLFEQMNIVLQHYREAVADLASTAGTGKDRISRKVTRKYAAELIKLSENIHFTLRLRPEFKRLLERMSNVQKSSALYDLYKELLTLLISNINNENEESLFFLSTLSDALTDVIEVVTESIETNTSSSENREFWNQKVRSYVENIGTQIEVNDSISKLQKYVAKEITDIMEAIKYKENFDKQEYEKRAKNYSLMEQRLKKVEAESLTYKSKLDEQKRLSMRDCLTSLPNRAALNEKLSICFNHSKISKQPLWLIIADIDNFKNINDQFGHRAGDKSLQVIASALQDSLRENQFIARFGGEEFVILVPDVSKPTLSGMLNRIREKINSIQFKFKDANIKITISSGATKVRASDPDEHFTFERADKALYKAKERGRDCVVID